MSRQITFNPIGQFRNEFDLVFEYAPLDELKYADNGEIAASCEYHKEQGATHWLFCSNHSHLTEDSLTYVRAAKILKTVAYVAIDEDEFGNVVWEKWPLKKNWIY